MCCGWLRLGWVYDLVSGFWGFCLVASFGFGWVLAVSYCSLAVCIVYFVLFCGLGFGLFARLVLLFVSVCLFLICFVLCVNAVWSG